jgi:hypothetical protein
VASWCTTNTAGAKNTTYRNARALIPALTYISRRPMLDYIW